jgi:exonuclease SbcC
MYATINSDFILTEGIINTLNQEIESKKHLLKEMQPQLEAKQLALQESCIPFGWNLNATLGDWDKELSVMNSQIVRLEQGEKEFNKKHLLEMILVEFEKIKPLNIRIRGLQNELGAKYSGKDIAKDTLVLIDTRKENGVKREERSQRLTAAELEVSVRETNANELKENLLMRMNDKGISNLDMYRIHIMDESRVQQIRSRLNQVDSLRISLETTKKTLEKDFYEQQQMDDITKDIQSLNVEFEQLSNSVQQYSEELGKQKEKLERNKQDTLRLKDSQTLLDQLRKDQVLWGRMNELIGEKTGNRFANFVQDLTFEQLIEFGNKRLESFSDRYLLALPSAVDTGDLQVMDTYMGNTTRSIFSLSGGETFKLSLALALGLSDLAARKVKIESLFIDEGFGSLDPDSLDEAVSLLEDIQNKGNKSIGIISHVSELKDRISTKVKLIPLGSGYSKIEVE